LFTDDLRGTLRETRAALARRDIVVSLADNISDAPSAVPVDIVGRRLRVATGVVDLALEAGAPITFALFFSDLQGGHVCRLRRVANPRDAAEVVRSYAGQLLEWCVRDIH